MRIVTRYVLKEFTRVLSLILLSLVLVFLVVDFLDRIDNFLEVHLPLTRVGYYYLLSVPSVLFQMAPVAVLVAVLISLGLLARHSEIIALKATGVSLFRLSRPIFLAALALSVFMFGLSDTIIPHTSAQANAIWNIEVEKGEEASSEVRRNIWLKGEKAIYYFRLYDRAQRIFKGVSLYHLDENLRLRERIEAQRACWEEGRWVFYHGLVKTYLPGGEIKVKRFEEETFPLPELPEKLPRTQRSAEEMSFFELARYTNRLEAEGYDPLRYQVDLHLKVSFPFICAIMALIGLPLAFWKERGGGIALGIGAGIGLSFVYLVFLGLSRALGYSGLLPPAAAAWLPNLIFVLLGLFLFTHVRQ